MFEGLGTTPAVVLLLLIGVGVWHFWQRAYSCGITRDALAGFGGWTLRGLFTPLGLWFVVNSGFLAEFPPLLAPDMVNPPGSAGWIATLPSRLGGSCVVMGSWWGAVSLLGLLPSVLSSLPQDREIPRHARQVGLLAALPSLGLGLVGGWAVAGFAAMVWPAIVLQALLPLCDRPAPTPLYSRAIAHLKFGRYGDAEQAVLAELEKRSDDYEGWMMLAELYARAQHDLPMADQTVRDLCAQPNLQPMQITLALHRLADWHLELGQNPERARQALALIEERLPGTHFAHMARQRSRQLPVNREELAARRRVPKLRLPGLPDPLDVERRRTAAERDPDAATRARELSARLTANPGDHPLRVEFARIMAEQLGEVETARQQIQLLLDLPDRPEERVPEWFSLLAAWQLRYSHDNEGARRLLERIVQEYPESPQAFTARRHLQLLERAATSGSG